MTTSLQCLECGTPLDSPETGGLCPKCLLKLGLANSTFGFTTTGLPQDGSGPLEFGSCRILRVLGKGGMGSVYEAEQRDGGRRVALKVLGQTLDTPELRSRFLREGQLAASVRHPNVVGILSAEEVDGTPVIVMELLHDGTLSERVKRDGPMPFATAVDAVLQIIDGLEAAHAVGVLHRDVKPANCFISSEGVVKVGDFGLSISTFAGLEQSLTQSGTLLGTPAFAAPEQLRGEDLDTRTDIYSVGATLYYLLTGRTPHEADNLVALIAAALTTRPADPRSLRKEIPAPLARVIMRCLERNKTQRPPGYAALRAALEPFRTEAAQPAMLGLRLIAGGVDRFLASAPWLAIAIALHGQDFITGQSHSWNGFLIQLQGTLISIAYYTLTEGHWGATPGKLLCGLRVARKTGGYPGFGLAFVRALVFHVQWLLPLLMFGLPANANTAPGWAIFSAGFSEILFLLLFVTMRRNNGYAMVQDLMTGTRVVTVAAAEDNAAIPGGASAAPATPDGPRLGPFQIVKRSGALLEAWDSVLLRSVWIVEREPGFPPLSEPRRNLNRPGRLRWLQSVRSPEENWDAFEAPAGQPLSRLADGAQPWGRVRRWLLDIATEFFACSRGGTRPDAISLSRIWITTHGQAVWVDFPLTENDGSFPMADPAALQRFLGLMGAACLGPGQPLHATRLLETLTRERLESIEMVLGNLRATLSYPAALTRRRRLVTLMLWPVLALVISILFPATFQPLIEKQMRNHPNHTAQVSESPRSDAGGSSESNTAIAQPPLSVSAICLLIGVLFFVFYLSTGIVISIVWTIVTGVPPGLQLYGLVILSRSGKPASRWLATIRTFLSGLAPALLIAEASALALMIYHPSPTCLSVVIGAPLILVPVAVHAYLRPQRAMPDLLLGTTIVPR